MMDSQKQRLTYLVLAGVFGIAGVVWIISGFLSPRFILYPCIGVVNLGIAYVCKKTAA